MELRFLGGAQEVGKSCIAVETDELRVAMDCGMKVFDHNEGPAVGKLDFDACILSHAHLDHSGCLPMLYAHNNIPTFCTFPTAPIVTLLLDDSEKIALQTGKPLPYTKSDAARLYRKFTPLPYNLEYEFFDKSKFEFYDAGHIPGSAGVLFEKKEGGKRKRVFYTGDFNYSDTRLLDKAVFPDDGVDALVIESTYAFREHPDRKEMERSFVESVTDCIDGGNVALVSSFAVGRSQEILLVLNSLLRGKTKVYYDGMGQKVANIISDFAAYVRNYRALSSAFSKTGFVEGTDMRRRIMDRPSVIVTTSGMLEGGPVLSYLQGLNRKGKGKVFLTGYQVEGTNGRALLEGGPLFINGKKMKVNLPFEHFDFSAHAGAKELREAIRFMNPKKVYCVHGDSCAEFAQDLRDKDGFDAVAPEIGGKYSV